MFSEKIVKEFVGIMKKKDLRNNSIILSKTNKLKKGKGKQHLEKGNLIKLSQVKTSALGCIGGGTARFPIKDLWMYSTRRIENETKLKHI